MIDEDSAGGSAGSGVWVCKICGYRKEYAIQQPPRTGDHTPILWYAALLCLSAAGMLMSLRRKKA